MNSSAASNSIDELDGILRLAVEQIASAPLPAGAAQQLIEQAAKWGPPMVHTPARTKSRYPGPLPKGEGERSGSKAALYLAASAALVLVMLLAAAIALVGGLPKGKPIAAAPKEDQTKPQASAVEKDQATSQSFGFGVTPAPSEVSPDKRLGGTQPFRGFGADGVAAQSRGVMPAGAAQQPDKTDQERMVGNWFITNDDSLRKGEMWVITEDNILMYAKHGGANANRYLHRLDAGQNPKQIDITVTLVNGQAVGIIKGLYALDGNELRLCLGEIGKDRPEKFPEKPAPGEVLILHRQEPAAEQPKAKGGPPDAKKVLAPEEAIKQMPKENVTVQFKVASVEVTGWYTGYPATYYVHLKDGGKFTAWVNAHLGFNDEDQILKLVKKLGIESVTDLRGKVVRVTGRVDESGLRMWVHDPANNVEVVKPKTDGKEQKPNEEKQPRAKEEELRALIDQVFSAHGGEDKLKKLQFMMTVKHSNGETQHYFVQPPKNFRWETTHRDRTGKRIVILFPEGRRWWNKEPNEAAREFIPTGAEPRMEYWLDYVKFFGPRQVLRLKDADHRVALLDEEAKIGDRSAIGVQVTGPLGTQNLFFDKETHLLLKGMGSDIAREVTFSDYKKFDGIPIAQKEHDGHFEPEVTDFHVVEKFDAKLFEGP